MSQFTWIHNICVSFSITFWESVLDNRSIMNIIISLMIRLCLLPRSGKSDNKGTVKNKQTCNLKLYICCCLWLAHQWLYGCLEGNILLQFLCWTLYPTCLCALSTSFSNSICPQSAGIMPYLIFLMLPASITSSISYFWQKLLKDININFCHSLNEKCSFI